MKNKEIRKMLEEIKEMINNKQIEESLKYIDKQIKTLSSKEDPASEYIDELTQNLK